MANDGNYLVRFPEMERTIDRALHARCNERLNDIKSLTLVFSIIPEIKPVVKQIRTNVLVFYTVHKNCGENRQQNYVQRIQCC